MDTKNKPLYVVMLNEHPTSIRVVRFADDPEEGPVFPKVIETTADWDVLRSLTCKSGNILLMRSLLEVANDGKELEVSDLPIAPALQELCEYITEDACLMVPGS